MEKFKAGDRVVVKETFMLPRYRGMTGTVSGGDAQVGVNMDVVESAMEKGWDPNRPEVWRGWLFPAAQLDLIPEVKEEPQLKQTLELLVMWENVGRVNYDQAYEMTRLGFDESARSMYADANTLMKITTSLRAALQRDGVVVPEREEEPDE